MPRPRFMADVDDLVFLQANRLTAGCAKQPLLQKPPVGFGRYLLYIGANYDTTDFCQTVVLKVSNGNRWGTASICVANCRLSETHEPAP